MSHVASLYDHKGKVKWEAAGKVTDQVVEIYKMANIPTINVNKIKQKVFDLHEATCRGLTEVCQAKRESPSSKSKILKFQKQLGQTMKFWQDGVEKDQCEEDRLFLESMKSNRKASIGFFDRVFRSNRKRNSSADGTK